VHEDYQRFVPKFDRLVKRHGKMRLLFEMSDFHGWELQAAWDDLKLGMKHFADIERIAMVGKKSWGKWMATSCRPFTKAKVRRPTKQTAEGRSALELPRLFLFRRSWAPALETAISQPMDQPGIPVKSKDDRSEMISTVFTS
jgi:hypothetical protein